MDQDSYKYYIYYQKEPTEDPKEIYVKLPILRLIYSLANYKYNQLSIPIYPNWDLTNKFIDFIKNLESDIIECFNTKKIDREFISLISKKNALNFIKAKTNDNIKLSSNLENKNITLGEFKTNGQISVVIKLSYIWTNNSKSGLSSEIYQIKYYAPPEQLNINFIDTEEPKIIIPIPPPMKNTEYINKPSTELPQQLGPKIIPSIKDLEKAIKKLKPIN